MREGHGIFDRSMPRKFAQIGNQEVGHVAGRRIDLPRAWPLERSSFHAWSPDCFSPWAITLHDATKQIARQRQRSRGHPEGTCKSLMHQSREPGVKAAFQGDSQQDHRGIRIEILLPRFMVGTCLPGIEETDEIWPRIPTLVPSLVLLGHAR